MRSLRSTWLLCGLLAGSAPALAQQESHATPVAPPRLRLSAPIANPLQRPADSPALAPCWSDCEVERRDRPKFQWKNATLQSALMLSVQHGVRLGYSESSRRELKGPFFKDWGKSIAGIQGWDDGDSIGYNYVGHPIQGAISGYVQIQNDPAGRPLEFSNSRPYWMSRLRAMGWAGLYSTQWEIGPISEATLGNFGKPGVPNGAGYVDLVITPTAGFGLIVAEDWVDKKLVRKLESGTDSRGKKRFFRILLNPQRSVANLLRAKVPWHRDSRALD